MKKFINKILLAVTAFIAGMGFTFMPIAANADAVEGGAETTTLVESATGESIEFDSSVELPATSDSATSEGIPDASMSSENAAIESGVTSDSTSSVEDESVVPDSSIENDNVSADEELIPQSDGSKWFDEYIMPLLVGLFAPLGGTVAGGGLLGWVLFKGVKGLTNLLKDALKGLSDAKEQTDKSNTNLATAKEQMAVWQTEQENVAAAWKENLTEEVKSFVASIQAWQAAQSEGLKEREAMQAKEMQAFAMNQEAAVQSWQTAQNELIKQWETHLEEQLTRMFDQLQKNVVNRVSDTNTTVHKLLDVEKIAYGDNPVLVSNGTAKKIAEVVDK